MKHYFRMAAAIALAVLTVAVAHAQFARSVDPLLGVSGGGNVFPGPAVSFGMIKPGPDMIPSGENDPNAGWNAKRDIRGFSQTRVSGTGGGAKYGNIIANLHPGHPRLFFHDADLPAIKRAIAKDPFATAYFQQQLAIGEKLLTLPPDTYHIEGAEHTLLATSRDMEGRIFTLAGLYRLTGDKRFANELLTSAFGESAICLHQRCGRLTGIEPEGLCLQADCTG